MYGLLKFWKRALNYFPARQFLRQKDLNETFIGFEILCSIDGSLISHNYFPARQFLRQKDLNETFIGFEILCTIDGSLVTTKNIKYISNIASNRSAD